MSGSAGGWRVAARLARREVRRRPGRTALVAALVAVPVAGMLVAVAVLRTDELSDTERWRLENGRADAVLDGDTAVTHSRLPEGSRTLEYTTVWRVVGTADGELCRCGLSDMPFEHLTDGLVQVTSGRRPERQDEVLLSEEAAEALRVGLGDPVDLVRPVELEATVVGIGYASLSREDPLVVVAPGAVALDNVADADAVQQLVDLPDHITAEEVRAWEERAGPHFVSPAFPMRMSTQMSGDNANTGVRWTWAGGAAGLTVLGVVIAAAFAASARRQLQTLGQLAANGGTPALLRRVLFLQGTVTGLIGSAAGLVLGALLLVAGRSRAPQLFGHAMLSWDVRLLDMLPVVVIAVVAATIAALVPAFGASRVSVLTALAGRRPLGRVSRRWTAVGLAMTVAGTGLLGLAAGYGTQGRGDDTQAILTACAVAGPVLLLLGVCTATPAYVTVLRPVARALRGPWRLAARSLFRQRTRTSAMVSAICAISAVAVAAAAVGLAVERDSQEDRNVYQPPDDMVVVEPSAFLDYLTVLTPLDQLDAAARQAQAALPGTERFDISEAVEPGEPMKPTFTPRDFAPSDPDAAPEDTGLTIPWQAFVVDDQLRAAFGIDAATQRLLDEHGAVWSGPAAGRVTIEGGAPEVPEAPDGPLVSPRPFTFVAGVLGPEHALGIGSSALLLTPQKTAELGLVVQRTRAALRAPAPLTAAQRDAAERLALQFQSDLEDAQLAGTAPTTASEPYVRVDFRRPGRYAGPGLIEAGPAYIALVFALFVVAVGLALAAVETRDERDVLAVLGAPPRTLRRASGYKAFLLTLLGGVIAVPVGLVPVALVTRVTEDGLPVVVPWRTIALLVVAVPVLAAALTTAASRIAARYRPVQVSTATFT